jgi:hypothetical protein
MRDFRIAQAKSILTVTSVAPVRGFYPPSVVAVGKNLNTTNQVFYNGVEATDFMISSSTRILVKLPPSQVGKAFTDIKVLSNTPVSTQDAFISLGLDRPAKTLQGLDRLIQAWLMLFMTTPGSDLFDPTQGGGVRGILGRNTDGQGNGIAADLAQAIERTNSQLLALQAQNRRIPPSERLLSASLTSISFDDQTSSLYAQVQLVNALGQNASVTVR